MVFDYSSKLTDLTKICNYNIGYLCCAKCSAKVVELNEKYLQISNIKIGEYAIIMTWLDDTLNKIYCSNKKGICKCYNIDDNLINDFIAKLKNYNIEFDNICCCKSKEHVIGYKRNGSYFIFPESELGVIYPDSTFEIISDKDSFHDNFNDYKMKINKFIEYRKSDEFIKELECKLCDIKNITNINEFSKHIKSEAHVKNMCDFNYDLIV